MEKVESGRLGGLATRDRHFTLCPVCGSPIKSQFYSEIGSKGGQANFEKCGTEGMAARGRVGGRGNKKNDIPAIRSNGHKQIQEGARGDLIASGSGELLSVKS